MKMKKKWLLLCLTTALLLWSGCSGQTEESAVSSSVPNASLEISVESEQETASASQLSEELPPQEATSAESAAEKLEMSAASEGSSSAVSQSASQSSKQTSEKPQQSSKTVSQVSRSITPVRTQPVQPAAASSQPAAADVQVSSISLNKASMTLTVGASDRLTASLLPQNASNLQFTWNVSDSSVVSIASDGTVMARAVGTAVITAETSNHKTASCTVTVKEAPQPSVPEQQPQPQVPVEDSGSTVGVDASWFDDAVFVGDSVTLKLSYYSDNGSLGNAKFLCAGSLGWGNALWDLYQEGNVHPSLYGTKYTVDEGIRASGQKKVFIMLGMNDIGLYGIDGSVENMKTLIGRILEKSPDVQIYIESVTPMLYNMQRSQLNNTTIPQFNSRLRQICSERGFYYMDIYSVVQDGYGNLDPSNCSDPTGMGIHFTDAGCSKWVNYLKHHVQ